MMHTRHIMINDDVAGKYSSGNVQDYHFKKNNS